MHALLHDVRYGIRQLFRQPGSSVVAVLTLALGIGVATAVFSVIDATMLRPLPYPDPEQLVTIGIEEVRADGKISRPTASMEDLRSWQRAEDVLSSIAGAGSAFRGRIADGPVPERLRVAHHTEHYLSMHGIAPVLGRGFSPADMEHGAALVALLGYGYWQSRFGGREDILGETIRLDTDVATIIGVLPAEFDPTTPVVTPLQIRPDMYSRRGTGRLSVYARLRPGVTIEQARDRLSALTPTATSRDGSVRQARARVDSRLEDALGRARTTVNVLASAVGLILLIAAVNVAGLLLARGAARQSELAVRAALGASRGRVVRQLLTESVILALPAAAIGILLAWLTLDLIVANLPLRIPPDSPAVVNLKVLELTLALLVPTVLLFGLIPALRLSRVHVNAVLARSSRQVGSSLSRRGSQVLIGVEIALAVVLVTGAGLMIRSFMRIAAVDLGFNPNGLVTMQVLPLERDPAAQREYYWTLQQQLQNLPEIGSVGIIDNFHLAGGGSYTSVIAGGKPTGVSVFDITPGYLETLGVTLQEGRLPTEADYTSGLRGVVLNESAARAVFPEGRAVGRDLIRAGSDTRPWIVLGVIRDVRHGGPLAEGAAMRGLHVFFPLAPDASDLTHSMTVVVRPSGSVPLAGERLRHAATSVGPRVLVEHIRTADDLFGTAVITPRRRTVLLGLLGGLGLVLALVGVFGMTAYTVTRRTAEIGVRMAFGARPLQVVGTMLRDSLFSIAIGTLLGVGAALLATRTIESFLFQTAPTDPLTLTGVAVILACTGCIAALVPALRAARLNPVVALRAE